MQHRPLGHTGIQVSALCLGTMTFGHQVNEREAHRQMDMAADAGVNFLDVAEMYPFPSAAKTWGDSERIIGSWLKARGNRERTVVATKASGPAAGWLNWIRGGRTRLDRANLVAAVDGSLERLGTDHIDLYQLHWPERSTNYFGKLGYVHARDDEACIPIRETLEVLAELIEAGKIRSVGLSNETPWGAMRFLAEAERHGLPRMASIQNPYSLLNRTFEIGLAEVAHREQCGLLAYSPLAFGVLTGKYADGARPAASRLALYPQFTRYTTEAGLHATDDYLALAAAHRLSPAQMALAYVTSRGFVTANIITASTETQLDEDLGSAAVQLSDEVLAAIEAIHEAHPNPCP